MGVTVAEVDEVTTAVGVPGVPGTAIGVTALLAALAPDVPAEFVAVEVKVYAVPLVRPLTVQEVAGTVTVQVRPPGAEVTV